LPLPDTKRRKQKEKHRKKGTCTCPIVFETKIKGKRKRTSLVGPAKKETKERKGKAVGLVQEKRKNEVNLLFLKVKGGKIY